MTNRRRQSGKPDKSPDGSPIFLEEKEKHKEGEQHGFGKGWNCQCGVSNFDCALLFK